MASYNHKTNAGHVTSLTVPVHEYLHSVQYAYRRLNGDPAGAWIGEGQARAIQDLVCLPIGADPCVNADDDISGSASYWGEVNAYLGDPNRPVNEVSYSAALFWTYLCQQYGRNRTEPHLGLDFISQFLTEADTDPDRDGIQAMNDTFSKMGYADDFEAAFKKFVVANYTKVFSGPNVPAWYRYVDEQQPATPPFNSVRLDEDCPLTAINPQVGPVLTDVQRWGARYYRFRPDPALASIQFDFKIDSSYPAYFTLLAIKNGDIASEVNHSGLAFARTITNAAYDEVAVIVAGLDHDVNFRYAVNATEPVLRILGPLSVRPASVGSHAAPEKFLLKLDVLSPAAEPISGIPAADFAFTVGSQAVPAANVITHAFVQGQYWFVLQAPGQSADGNMISALPGPT